MHNRGKSGVADRERDAGDGGDGARQSTEELLLTNVQDLGGEALAVIVDLGDAHSVGEGRDVEHVEQRSLGGADLAAGLDELKIGRDLDGTTGNLGGDTEGLEEGGLAGLHTSVPGRNPDVGRGHGTSTSRGGDLIGEDLVTDLLQVGVGEDETDVALDMGKETLVLGVISLEGLESTTNLYIIGISI